VARKQRRRRSKGGRTSRTPGVYVEEVGSGSRPIEGVGTAVAAFVGIAERGPVNSPRRVAALVLVVTGTALAVRALRSGRQQRDR
jgi:phage tail sheath protein FI